MKRTTTLLAALFALAAIAGCSDKSGGNPKPEATSPSTNTESESPSTPSGPELNLAKYLEKPCDVLTAAQVSSISNVKTPPTTRKAPLGPSCRYQGKELLSDSSFSVTLADGQKYDSLLGNSRNSPVFSETKVGELRAFSSDDTDGTRDCTTAVEAGKESALIVQINVASELKGVKKPCEESQKIAAAAISTLKG